MREFEFIEWVRAQAATSEAVEVGPGDDCAVLDVGGEKLLLTADQVLEGVHVSLTRHGPAAAGRKAAARGLSDIAAMAGLPVAMVATVAAGKGLTAEDARAIHDGLRSVGDAFDCPLVGGDLAAWSDAGGRLAVSVTVLGRAGGVGPVLRRGAAPGHALCVTGAFGGAWRGRRHLSFRPRVPEARTLAADFDVSAMIDVSDGLAVDLGRLADAGGVAAEVHADHVPIADDARDADDPLAAALFDGEDYELLFALPAGKADELIAAGPLAVPVARIGVVAAGSGLTLIRNGRREVLPARGWEHET